jgi:hypothetical protein
MLWRWLVSLLSLIKNKYKKDKLGLKWMAIIIVITSLPWTHVNNIVSCYNFYKCV